MIFYNNYADPLCHNATGSEAKSSYVTGRRNDETIKLGVHTMLHIYSMGVVFYLPLSIDTAQDTSNLTSHVNNIQLGYSS